MRLLGIRRLRTEASPDWVLLDAGDLVIHLFKPEARANYALERMWGPDSPAPEDSSMPSHGGTAADDTPDGSGELVVLEVNTQPGMTETSLVPEIAAHAGYSFGELVKWMVEDASLDR